jgi:ribosome recycling factor
MNKAMRTCPVCLKEFCRMAHTIYCSPECREVGLRVVRRTANNALAKYRAEKFQKLVNYSQQNKIKKLVKKYMPKIKKSNENA